MCVYLTFCDLSGLKVVQMPGEPHSKGGHNVPSRDVRRRFVPSLLNFFRRYLPLADEALLFDAAAYPPQLIARWAGGKKKVIDLSKYEAVRRQAKI